MARSGARSTDAELWIFGYGSLLWRPDFPHVERRAGWVDGWSRRFWQGSTDHRGLPHAPGRVATLVRESGARCWGAAYRVEPASRNAVLARLDHRERGGFDRIDTTVRLAPDGATSLRATVYVASADNPNYLGPAPDTVMADQIRASRGPSGANREYLYALASALRELGARDPHVFALESLVRTGAASDSEGAASD